MSGANYGARRHSESADRRTSTDLGVILAAVLAIVFGIAFRFSDLGAPLFWQDEAYTALRVTGHSAAVYNRLFDGKIHSVAQIRAFESVAPGRGVPVTVSLLAREDPHHAPLFYVLDRLWVGAFGTTAAGFRGLSAVLGSVGILIAFFLGRALLGLRRGGLICASLLALSPIFVLYSRQSREYALFADAAMVATLAFIWAARGMSLLRWAVYAASVALGLYADPIFLLVAVSHAAAALLLSPPRAVRFSVTLVAIAVGLTLFAPWGLNATHRAANIDTQMDWARTAYPLRFLAVKWGFNLAALVFDGDFAHVWLAPSGAVVLLLLGLALVLTVRSAPPRFWAIVAPLGLITLAVFVGRDALVGSHYETIPRYLTPFWLAVLLVLACALETGLARPKLRAITASAGVAIVALGIAAGFIRGATPNWWDNDDQIAFQSIATRINEVQRPLVITQAHWHVPLVLARYLRDDAQFLLFTGAPPDVPANRNAFLIAPTSDVRGALMAETRGRYTWANVSPPPATPIAAFHRRLDQADPAMYRGDAPAFAPSNALYALTPSKAFAAKVQ